MNICISKGVLLIVNCKYKLLTFYICSFVDNNYKVEAIPKGYEITMRLTVRSVRPQDFGSFRCVATNSLGETDGKIKVYSK